MVVSAEPTYSVPSWPPTTSSRPSGRKACPAQNRLVTVLSISTTVLAGRSLGGIATTNALEKSPRRVGIRLSSSAQVRILPSGSRCR